MSTTNQNQISPEQIEKWQLLDELDNTAISGPSVSEAKFQQICDSIKNHTYLQEDLELVQKRQQKLQKELALLKDIETTIIAEIAKKAS